ncbi:MAG TPA: TetR family transcriptional regulator [Pseudonocardiaceae bacterium]|nr:TetR family transcriptional regulator [Pseudonocardiaceae bacterium]
MPPAQPPSDTTGTGLRERKRAKVRREIQANALRLFHEQGYEATTVQQIAEAAVISESTFYRYFPTKADIVLQDDLDPVFVRVFREQPPELSAVDAFRATATSVLGSLSAQDVAHQRERMELIQAVPELRAQLLDQYVSGLDLLAEELALRTGRSADDVAVRALAGAVVGVGLAVISTTARNPGATDMARLLDEALAALPEGLTL